MLFLHLYCKKENFLPFTTWLFLSSFGVLLTSNLGTHTYLIKQTKVNDIVGKNTLDPQNKCDRLNITITKNEKSVTFHIDSILPINLVQDIILSLFLIISIMICTQFVHLQTQYFANKRAPPLA